MSESQEESRYFRAIEDTFIRLRGTPFLLSPADYQVARRWRREGLPVGLVCRSLERFFERRRERGVTRRIESLRYCAPAVESDWRELRELAAPARRNASERLPIAQRLDLLRSELPSGLSGVEAAWRGLSEMISEAPAAAPEVEERLEVIEAELLAALERALGPDDRVALEAGIDRSLAPLAQRLSPRALGSARERLWREALRRHHGLPVLSLFSPEARGEKAS